MEDIIAIAIVAFFFCVLIWQLLTGFTLPLNDRPSYLRHRQPGPYWRSIIVQGLILMAIAAGLALSLRGEDLDDGWENFGRQTPPVREAVPGGAPQATNDSRDRLEDLRHAVERAPSDFEAHRQLDDALARQGRWDEILSMWNRYLALHPNDAEAWFERGGTNYRRGDTAAARADATRACELGKREACERLERLKAGS